jgi:hypothetical protein
VSYYWSIEILTQVVARRLQVPFRAGCAFCYLRTSASPWEALLDLCLLVHTYQYLPLYSEFLYSVYLRSSSLPSVISLAFFSLSHCNSSSLHSFSSPSSSLLLSHPLLVKKQLLQHLLLPVTENPPSKRPPDGACLCALPKLPPSSSKKPFLHQLSL